MHNSKQNSPQDSG